MNYTIIRLSSIGDIVLTSALIRSIKVTDKTATIDFVTDKAFKEVLEFNPHINKILLYDKKKSLAQNDMLRKEINTNSKIIDLQNNLRTRILRRNFSNVVKIEKRRLQKLALVHLKKFPKKQPIIPLLYIQAAKDYGIKYDGGALEFWLEEERNLDFYPPERRATNFCLKKIAIAPGAKHFTKRWLSENFIKTIEKIHQKYNVEFCLLGGRSDMNICQEIEEKISALEQNIHIKNFAGQTSLLTSAQLLDTCDLILTNDTGLMHIAAARRVPVMALFGSTVKEFGFAPFGVQNIVCETELKCRPCTHIGRASCPQKHFNCMSQLSPDKVFHQLIDFIQNLEEKNLY